MTTKPLYILIKLDVDGEIVFDNDNGGKYAKNFCNNLEFEYIDHCLEEKENKDLYIGCDPDARDLTDEEIWNCADEKEVWP